MYFYDKMMYVAIHSGGKPIDAWRICFPAWKMSDWITDVKV
jgi:hypothetical protein